MRELLSGSGNTFVDSAMKSKDKETSYIVTNQTRSNSGLTHNQATPGNTSSFLLNDWSTELRVERWMLEFIEIGLASCRR